MPLSHSLSLYNSSNFSKYSVVIPNFEVAVAVLSASIAPPPTWGFTRMPIKQFLYFPVAISCNEEDGDDVL